MAVVHWTESSCPHCKHELSFDDIARAHFLKRCPACQSEMAINAQTVLERSTAAVIAGIVGMLVGTGSCAIALVVAGVNGRVFDALSPALRGILFFAIISVGAMFALYLQKRQVRSTLKTMRAVLEGEGKL